MPGPPSGTARLSAPEKACAATWQVEQSPAPGDRQGRVREELLPDLGHGGRRRAAGRRSAAAATNAAAAAGGEQQRREPGDVDVQPDALVVALAVIARDHRICNENDSCCYLECVRKREPAMHFVQAGLRETHARAAVHCRQTPRTSAAQSEREVPNAACVRKRIASQLGQDPFLSDLPALRCAHRSPLGHRHRRSSPPGRERHRPLRRHHGSRKRFL